MKQQNAIILALLKKNIRVIAISGKDMVAKAQQIHGLSRVMTAALGRQLMATAMMTMQLKHEQESLTTILRGDGPAGNLVCTGRFGGRMKAYAAHPEVELPLKENGKLDVSGAVGTRGKMTVIRDLSMREPYVGECNLATGEIAEDFAHYFTVSEQTPSLVYLGVRVNAQDGAVRAAGGLIAQPLPGCPEEDIDALQELAGEIGTLNLRLENGEVLSEALLDIFRTMEPEIAGESRPKWECDCSRQRTERALIALGEQELNDMIKEDGGAELTCQFCNAAYRFSGEDLTRLLEEAGGTKHAGS